MAKPKTAKTPFSREVSTGNLAWVLGCSTRRVAQLVEEGTLEKTRRGTFALDLAVQGFIRHQVGLAEKAAAKAIAAAESGGREYTEAKAAWMVEKAAAAKLARQRSEGAYWPEDDVKMFASALIVRFKTNARALPNACVPELFACKTMPELGQLLLRRIDEMLSRLAHQALEDENGEFEIEADYKNIQI
jgi:phage terminase Nu1 subunit (DNA packaging protein)